MEFAASPKTATHYPLMRDRAEHRIMTSRVLAFCHYPTEPLGYFEDLFREWDVPYEYVRLYETNEVPKKIDATHLVFLGGPMSVNDESEFPWLKEEKQLIRCSRKAGQKVLGICLGAQLIASAHGAKVYRFVNETGWHVVRREPYAAGIFSHFPEEFQVFQFHSETFGLPYGGRLLASGAAVRNQAFSFQNALGLQFHLELTGAIIRDWSTELRRHQQEKIARDTPRFLDASNRLCRLVAEDFLR